MCIETHPPVDRDLKLAPRAKVFVEGKNRPLFVSDEPASIDAQLDDQSTRLLRVTNLNGEATTIRKRKVVSAVAVNTDRHRVEADPMVMEGRKVSFRSYDLYRRQELRYQEEHGGSMRFEEYPEGTIAVLAEDMGEVLILAVSVTGEILWENQASAPESIARYVRAARLVAQAETIQLAEDRVTYAGSPAEADDDAESPVLEDRGPSAGYGEREDA